LKALVHVLCEDSTWQKPRILRKHRDDTLQNKPLRDGTIFATCDYAVEDRRHFVCRTARNCDPIVVEERLSLVGEKKVERLVSFREFVKVNRVDRLIELEIEVVDPELAKVAEDNVPWPMGHQALPILEGLSVVPFQRLATFLHFEQESRLPHEIGESGALLFLFYPMLKCRPGLLVAGVTEGLEQAVAEHLGLTFFIAAECLCVIDERLETRCFLGAH
jgi:hypothetical protein